MLMINSAGEAMGAMREAQAEVVERAAFWRSFTKELACRIDALEGVAARWHTTQTAEFAGDHDYLYSEICAQNDDEALKLLFLQQLQKEFLKEKAGALATGGAVDDAALLSMVAERIIGQVAGEFDRWRADEQKFTSMR